MTPTGAQHTALAGRAVVVTGAGGGLGESYARAVVAHGGSVVVNDVDADRAASVARSLGVRAVAHPADISDWAAAGALVERCVTEFGAIDGLVNNAGVLALSWPHEQSEADARRLVDVNLFGAIACGTHALRHMVARGRGAVVNVTSGEQAGNSASAVYGATKAAVAALTASWAQDVAAHGVRVNAVSPNAQTAMAEVNAAFRGTDTRNDGLTPEVNAPLVVYLLSDRAHVTGQVLRLHGDELMLMSRPAVLEPVARCPEWTVASVEDAVDGPLRSVRQPFGLRRVPS
ncbi:SDR family oxidoreductase [Actinosynnema sp. NPDC020468]|uniref:SDR family NAD(P)-dependent oxidoreductase n=1 Tax=Actinosynnema sp. NPDC020468 TaxID=3154488 RepID=UPI0033E482D1